MSRQALVQLRFLKPLEKYKREKPYWLFVGKPDGADVTNVSLEAVSGIPIHDVRGEERNYELDEHGFKFFSHNLDFEDFHDDQRIEREYLPQVEKMMLEKIPSANKVFVFNWRLRKEMGEEQMDHPISPAQIHDTNFVFAPSQTVHSDSTEFTLLKRVKKHLPEEADLLLQGRVQMINFWRPICHEVGNWPLVLCDGRSTPLKNLVAVDQISRRFVGDLYYATYDPGYRWHYLSSMGVGEGVLFKCWDTGNKAPSKGMYARHTVYPSKYAHVWKVCLHSSCDMPKEMLPKVYHPRLSIECRALVFSAAEDST
ncbi:hypothetical protein F5Y05DRAFT_79894 [Hypoxylon sp. FL0543]|nr:hypothetical protein F5Y05DRAFT_79894 [Hypoxylon sp. FL0543]